MADDAVDLGCWDYGLCGGDDVEEQCAATDLVQDFGALTLEPRAFACGHDGDGEFVGVHRCLSSHGGVDSLASPLRQALTKTSLLIDTRMTASADGSGATGGSRESFQGH